MENKIPSIRELDAFLGESQEKVIAYMRNSFSSLRDEDLQDIYQESSVALYKNIKGGKLKTLTSSLLSYFIQININQARKFCRHQSIRTEMEYKDGVKIDQDSPIREDRLDELLLLTTDDEEEAVQRRKEDLVQEILNAMMKKCHDLLWSFYAEGLNWETVAGMCSLANANTAKASATRCKDQFRKKYNELISKIYGK